MPPTVGRTFVGAALKATPADIIGAAAHAVVPVLAFRALLQVETAGAGFDTWGRPIILYEPHVCYRNVTSLTMRAALVAKGLAYQAWGTRPYPKGQDAQYARLDAAMALMGDVALKACSWGLGQILGEGYAALGYSTPRALVLDAMASEGHQMDQVAGYLLNNHLSAPLRALDFDTVAKGYNGTGQWMEYGAKLRSAYATLVGALPAEAHVPLPSRLVIQVPGRITATSVNIALHPATDAESETEKLNAMSLAAARNT